MDTLLDGKEVSSHSCFPTMSTLSHNSLKQIIKREREAALFLFPAGKTRPGSSAPTLLE